MEYLHKLCGILLHRRFVYSPLFIYLFIYPIIYLCHYGLMDIYSILWVITQYYYYYYYLLLCCSNCFRFGHWDLFQLASMSLWHIPIIVGVFLCGVFFEHFLTFWHYKILQAHIVYSLPRSESAIFPRSTASSYYRMVLETKIWVLGVLTATEVSLLLGLRSWQSKEICLYILTHVYTHIYKYFYMYHLH